MVIIIPAGLCELVLGLVSLESGEAEDIARSAKEP